MRNPNKRKTWKQLSELERQTVLKAMGLTRKWPLPTAQEREAAGERKLDNRALEERISRSTGKLEAQRVKRAEEK